MIQNLPKIITLENGSKQLMQLLMEQLPLWDKQLQQEFFQNFSNPKVLNSISSEDKEILVFKVIHIVTTTDQLYFKKVINHHSNSFLVCPRMDQNDIGVVWCNQHWSSQQSGPCYNWKLYMWCDKRHKALMRILTLSRSPSSSQSVNICLRWKLHKTAWLDGKWN